MNDREKMLADLRDAHEAMSYGDTGAAGQFVGNHSDTIEALLTEPTLEEVLAELGHYGVPQLWETPDGWRCMVTIDQGIEGEATEATPLQAARECLRRVKE